VLTVRRALAFLTPFVRGGPPDAATFDWFPVAGAAIGLVLGGVWWLADRMWYPGVAAAVVVAAVERSAGAVGADHVGGAIEGRAAHGARTPAAGGEEHRQGG